MLLDEDVDSMGLVAPCGDDGRRFFLLRLLCMGGGFHGTRLAAGSGAGVAEELLAVAA